MKRYKERWDKLIESAKKRRENNKQGDPSTPHISENPKQSPSSEKLYAQTTSSIQQPQTDQNSSSSTQYKSSQNITTRETESLISIPIIQNDIETTYPVEDTSPTSSMMTALTSAQSIYN